MKKYEHSIESYMKTTNWRKITDRYIKYKSPTSLVRNL